MKDRVFTIPNMLSFLRICLIPLIVWLYTIRKDDPMAGYMLLLSGATDIADGFIARKCQMTSDLGKILDPVADKLTQAAMLICLMIRFPLASLPFLLLIAKETYMSISGFLIVKKTGVVMGADWHGKAATCFLYGMMALHIFWYHIPPAASGISIILSALMIALSFILYGIRNSHALRKEGDEK